MKNIILLFLVVLLPSCIYSQSNGTIVHQSTCPPKVVRTYKQYVDAAKNAYKQKVDEARKQGINLEIPANFSSLILSREEYERRQIYTGVDCQRITYMSDSLKVIGYIWKPKVTKGKKLPLVIFNRGGNRERSKLEPWMADGFYDFVSNGFVVIGSQYRGNDGGEGKDEYGGDDVNDVLNLIPLAKSLGYVDMNNIFMFGNSRGGMMTYLAIKNGVSINAAAVMSGVADLFGNAQDHPALVTTIYKELIPEFDKRREEALSERSAVMWVDKINVPVLIMHGNADSTIDASRTIGLVQNLQKFHKRYEFIIYEGGDHGLSLHRKDSDRRVLEWFKKHIK